MLTAVDQRDLDALDPELDDSGVPTAYSIQYPDLLFNRTPTAISYRLRYLQRPTALAASTDAPITPEFADEALIARTYWILMATREDSTDFGGAARTMYLEALTRAIAQDKRRMDRLYVMQSAFPGRGRPLVPFPSNYGAP